VQVSVGSSWRTTIRRMLCFRQQQHHLPAMQQQGLFKNPSTMSRGLRRG